jgi:hypothetical protein
MAFPGTYNFNYYRGDTFEFLVKPKDASGNPFNLADYDGAFTIANLRGSAATEVYEGTAVVNTIDDLVTCTITSGIGRNLVPTTSWVYDVQVTNDINTYTLLSGTITVTDDITGATE